MAITYLEAIREALAKVLAENDTVYIYGQDVAEFGGAFKATKGLAERFPGRVVDSPISEDAMIGSAVGAAIEGMRPIIENAVRGLFLDCFQPDRQSARQHFTTEPGLHARSSLRLPSGGNRGKWPFSQSEPGIHLCAITRGSS